MDSGFAISFFTANNIRLLIISCPTAFSTYNVEIISITSCSQTSISERTSKHLQSKSGETSFSSFKLDIEQKYLFKISAFSMDSYDNLKSFCGSEREGVSLDGLSFIIYIFMVLQYNLPLADFNSS